MPKKHARFDIDAEVLTAMKHQKIDTGSKTWNDHFKRVVEVMARDADYSHRRMKKADEDLKW